MDEFIAEERKRFGRELDEKREKIYMSYELEQRRLYDKIMKVFGEKAREIEELNVQFFEGDIDIKEYVNGFEIGLKESGMSISLMEFMRDYAKDYLVEE